MNPIQWKTPTWKALRKETMVTAFALVVCTLLLGTGYKVATYVRKTRAKQKLLQERLQRVTGRQGD